MPPEEPKARYAFYTRVSLQGQTGQTSIADQEAEVARFVQHKGGK